MIHREVRADQLVLTLTFPPKTDFLQVCYNVNTLVIIYSLPFYFQTECKKTEKADIIFLVDGSTSITLRKFRSMQTFMESIVNQTTVGKDLTRFGVILYSTDPKSVFTLNKYTSKREVLQAIAALKSPYGDTYTSKALGYSLQFFGAENGGRAALQVPQILMVITDGDATDRNNLVAPSVALRNNRISVVSIGVEGANRTQLEIMAGHDTSKVFYVDNFDALETLYKNITEVLCQPGKRQRCHSTLAVAHLFVNSPLLQ